ncbi:MULTISPECIES: hypothetical protein [unclassified Candidatus Tisiphia]|uniref:hypothetical protein n=1 Tax=unclassified Candidatus Tisiphia TaxID=2996318 RepID=UPI00312C6EB0
MNYISIYLNFCLDKGDHLTLAKRVIEQMDINTREYLEWYKKEAEERGFCRKSTEELIARHTDTEDE